MILFCIGTFLILVGLICIDNATAPLYGFARAGKVVGTERCGRHNNKQYVLVSFRYNKNDVVKKVPKKFKEVPSKFDVGNEIPVYFDGRRVSIEGVKPKTEIAGFYFVGIGLLFMVGYFISL